MKKMGLVKAFSVAVFLLLLFLGEQVWAGSSGANYYTLICKGGDGMKLVISYDSRKAYLYAKAGSTPGNPGPGECVWPDREVREEETTSLPPGVGLREGMVIVLPMPDIWNVIVYSGGVSFSSTDVNLNYICGPILEERAFYLEVRRTAKGTFEGR